MSPPWRLWRLSTRSITKDQDIGVYIDSGSDWCSMSEEMWGELEFTEIG